MIVGLLHTKDTLRAKYLLTCFSDGVHRHGDDTIWITDRTNYREPMAKADVFVRVCAPNKHHADDDGQGKFRVDSDLEARRLVKRILTIDSGHLKSQTHLELTVASKKGAYDEVLFSLDKRKTYEKVLRSVYYQVTWDGLKRTGSYPKPSGPDRWLNLDMPLQPWRTTGRHILLIGQTFHGLSSQDTDLYGFYKKVVRRIRARSERLIVMRQHPRIMKIRTSGSRIGKDRRAVERAIGVRKDFRYSKSFLLTEDLVDCWAAVSFSSNAAVEAVVAGIPVFAMSESNMAWPVAGHDLEQIEDPPQPDREKWAWQMAYAQYSPGEMMDGTVWALYRPDALKPPTPGPSF